MEHMEQAFTDKEALVGSETLRKFEKSVMLHSLDTHWRDHLTQMEHLRQSVSLRGYAQKDPRQEYKREAFEMFSALLSSVKYEVTTILAKVHVPSEEEMREMAMKLRAQQEKEQAMEYIHEDANVESPEEPGRSPEAAQGAGTSERPFVRTGKKVGRNESCPCGSGKKFKQCHGKL